MKSIKPSQNSAPVGISGIAEKYTQLCTKLETTSE